MIKAGNQAHLYGRDIETGGLIGFDYGVEDAVVIVVLQGKDTAVAIDINHEVSGGIMNHPGGQMPFNRLNHLWRAKWRRRARISGGASPDRGYDSAGVHEADKVEHFHGLAKVGNHLRADIL